MTNTPMEAQLERLAQAMDRMLGMTTAVAAFVACLPGAEKVDLAAAKRMTTNIAGSKVSSIDDAASPSMRAEGMLEAMALLAKQNSNAAQK